MSSFVQKVIDRIGDQRLIQLTNETGGTTINNTTLAAACEDAEGTFERLTGIVPDVNIKAHVAIIVEGVQYKLEDYKSRNGGIMTQHGKNFYNALEKFREKTYLKARSNSCIESVPCSRRDRRADMDRRRPAFGSNRFGLSNRFSEVSDA